MAEQESVFEFLLSSPVHPPVSYRLYPEVGLLETGPQGRQDKIITTRLQARSNVRTLVTLVTLVTLEPGAFIGGRK